LDAGHGDFRAGSVEVETPKVLPLSERMINPPDAVPQKACPVVLRETDLGVEILAFRHPLAGCQLVKGTIEHGETAQCAAERELFEESGVAGVAKGTLGAMRTSEPEQEWHFVLCDVGLLAEAWTHRTSDGGGLDFAFFWHRIADAPDDMWHPIFRQALAFIVRRIGELERDRE
jgi:ADP-ribose pyrophosphatase YjhB (NUDIX family)